MSVLENIKSHAKGMLLDGIGASEHIDSSGEILDVAGCDISDIEAGTATINYDHKDRTLEDTIGRVVYAKKIYSEEDCDDERQLMYWKKTGVPYIYIIGELMDEDGHPGAVAAAAVVRHYYSRKIPIVARWSIEGSTIDKTGPHLKESIFKRIALTLKPCNKDATSGVLFDPLNKPDEASDLLDKNEKITQSGLIKLGGSVEIECMPFLEKALTAGGGNTAPSTLVNGDALALSSFQDPKERIKHLIRQWNGTGTLKNYLKMQMPEVSDEFLDKFAEAADKFSLKIKKYEELHDKLFIISQSLSSVLKKDEEDESVMFNGKKVNPGEGYLKVGMGNMKPMAILGEGEDDQGGHAIAVPYEKLKNYEQSDLVKIPHDHPNFTLARPHETQAEAQESRVIDAAKHSINPHPDSQFLVHGLDLDGEKTHFKEPGGINSNQTFWTKNAEGKNVFVKPDSFKSTFGEARREAAFHNVAKDFFGLGNYVPNVGAVSDPKSGVQHAVVEAVPGEHMNDYSAPNQHHINTMKKLGDSGELDKLAVMDMVLGNHDRHNHNFLVTPEGSMKLIDHGMNFDSAPTRAHTPKYLSHYHNIAEKEAALQPGVGHENKSKMLNPAAVQWIKSLNTRDFKKVLRANKVPGREAQEAVRRLQALKDRILFEHHGKEGLDHASQGINFLDNVDNSKVA